jgi:hypothetical protein
MASIVELGRSSGCGGVVEEVVEWLGWFVRDVVDGEIELESGAFKYGMRGRSVPPPRDWHVGSMLSFLRQHSTLTHLTSGRCRGTRTSEALVVSITCIPMWGASGNLAITPQSPPPLKARTPPHMSLSGGSHLLSHISGDNHMVVSSAWFPDVQPSIDLWSRMAAGRLRRFMLSMRIGVLL